MIFRGSVFKAGEVKIESRLPLWLFHRWGLSLNGKRLAPVGRIDTPKMQSSWHHCRHFHLHGFTGKLLFAFLQVCWVSWFLSWRKNTRILKENLWRKVIFILEWVTLLEDWTRRLSNTSRMRLSLLHYSSMFARKLPHHRSSKNKIFFHEDSQWLLDFSLKIFILRSTQFISPTRILVFAYFCMHLPHQAGRLPRSRE